MLSRTAFSAHSALRPRSAAIDRTNAAVSFSTFFAMSFPASSATSFPPLVTGWAAPMFAAGCITATFAAMVRKTPAEAACAPAGPTHTTIGTSLASIAWTISRVASSAPPGVSSAIASAAYCSSRAFLSAAPRYSAVPPVMAPFTSTESTRGGDDVRREARRRRALPRRERAHGGEDERGGRHGAADGPDGCGHRYLLGGVFPSSFITSCRSSHAFPFSFGLRRR